MRKLEISDADVMGIAIRQEIERNEEARYDHRLHGLLLVAKGMSARQAALWLDEGERPGRPSRISDEQWQGLEEDLRRSPRELGFEQTLWDGVVLAEHLRRRYRVELGVRQCQRLFRQRGFRLRKPRPVIAKADPAAQAAFKKTAAPGRRFKR